MKSYFVLALFSLVIISSSVATDLERARIAELKQKIDEGIKLHQVMGRELPVWFQEFKEKMVILDKYWLLSNEEICEKREEIRQKIQELEDLIDKIKLAWDLKGEQLVELTEILHHTKYDTTGLKNFTHEEEDCKKPLHDYIQGANTTHIEEGKIIKEYEQYILDNIKKWEEHPCDCVWGEWGDWTDCTKTCGGGTRNRERKVAEPAINGGKCEGSTIDDEECNVGCCPVDCRWTEWTEWSECPAHCPYCPARQGDGKITRHRTKEEHQCGGAPCEGEAEESQDCNIVAILLEKVGELEKDINGCRDKNEDLNEKLCSMLDCQNGGVCEQGACKCIEGYIGARCEVERCPSVSGGDFEKTLEFITIEKTQAEAQKHCENNGKKLVSVDSAEKAEYINTKIKGHIWWTSGKRMTGNTWSWGLGEATWPAAKADENDCMYRNWYTGEPNNHGGHENCIEIYAHSGVAHIHLGEWNDDNCDRKRPFICEGPDCSKLNCQNGGVCKQGACQCKGGYTGKSCEVAPDEISGVSLTTASRNDGAPSGQHYGSENSVALKICQQSRCCMTKTFPGVYNIGETIKFSDPSTLSDCSTMKVSINEEVKTTIISSSSDGWRADKVSIYTSLGQKMDCPVDAWLDKDSEVFGPDSSFPSFEAICTKVEADN